MPLATRLYNITAAHECFAGVRKVLQWTVTDADGAAVDITGFTFRFTLRKRGDVTGDPLLELDDTAFTITNGAGGIVQQVIPAADMPSHDTYDYKLFGTDTDDHEDVAARGTFLIQP